MREDVIRVSAVALAATKAAGMAQAAARGSFAASAKAAGVEVKTTELITRGTPYPEVGVNTAVDNAVFALAKGATSGTIQTDSAVVVARVVDRTDVTPEALAAGKSQTSDQVLQQRRQDFFAAYMTKAKLKIKITFNEAALRTIFGS